MVVGRIGGDGRPRQRFDRARKGHAVEKRNASGAIPLVEPALVFALELVVEKDAINVPATLRQALRGVFVRAIDLEVVCELSLAFDAMPERLAVALIAVAMVFEEASTPSAQRDRVLARAGTRTVSKSLFTQVSRIVKRFLGTAAHRDAGPARCQEGDSRHHPHVLARTDVALSVKDDSPA
jgi:hypothetical protein